ncbi:MAG: hypothetical protein QM820_22760 [Minicystis sp.]
MEQLSLVQGLWSSSGSLESTMRLTCPLPLHTAFLQSPAVCAVTGVPCCV